MSKISSFMWFNQNAQEIVNFYTSIFKNSKKHFATPEMATFEIEGQVFQALNGGDYYKQNESFSTFVVCQDQSEIDFYWESLTANGGKAGRCGWLEDKYGLSWQIIPNQLGKLMMNHDQNKTLRVHEAMIKMEKLLYMS